METLKLSFFIPPFFFFLMNFDFLFWNARPRPFPPSFRVVSVKIPFPLSDPGFFFLFIPSPLFFPSWKKCSP